MDLSFFETYPELAEYCAGYERSINDYIHARFQPLSDDPLRSRLGGKAYWTADATWPQNKAGTEPLRLLAQINFEELPPLKPLPTTGILQLFIAADDTYGYFSEDHAILYHPKIEPDALIEPPLVTTADKMQGMPLRSGHDMDFELAQEGVPLYDPMFRFYLEDKPEDVFAKISNKKKRKKAMREYSQANNPCGVKIWGYFCYHQVHPEKSLPGKDRLLLQLDSSTEASMQWGDGGVARLQSSYQELLDKKLEEAVYSWDS